jgi:uncharacterized membrane protein
LTGDAGRCSQERPESEPISADQGGANGDSQTAGDNAAAVRQAQSLYLLFNPKKAKSGLSMARPPVPLAAMSIQSAVKSPLSVARQRAVLRRFSRAHLLGVSILTAFIAALYSVFSLIYYIRFRASSYDLVIFDQAIRSYSHFHLGISVIKGVHNGFGPHFSLLGDHFSPILASLAPLYWIYGGPQTLLIAQACLYALAIPPLWIFTRRAFGGGQKATIAAYLISAAYGLSWPIAAAAAFDFHEAAFAPVLTAIALERIQAGKLRGTLIALGALLLVKEDMGLLVAGIGLYLLVSMTPTLPRQRLVAIAVMVGGLFYTMIAVYMLIPAFGGQAGYYWAYSRLGHNVPQVIEHILRHPVSTFHMLFKPWVKGRTYEWLLASFAFLPLLSPITLAAIPLLLERMLNDKFPSWWLLKFQYNSFILVILVCAAVDTAVRIDRWAKGSGAPAAQPESGAQPVAGAVAEAAGAPASAALATAPAAEVAGPAPEPAAASPRGSAPGGRGRGPGAGVVGLALCAVVLAANIIAIFALPMSPLKQMFQPSFYEQTARTRAATAALDTVPNGVVVEAANDVGPELSSRDTVLLWDGEAKPLGAPWVVADVELHVMTFANINAQVQRVQLLVRSGEYKIVFQRDGFIVLHRVRGHFAGVNSLKAWRHVK